MVFLLLGVHPSVYAHVSHVFESGIFHFSFFSISAHFKKDCDGRAQKAGRSLPLLPLTSLFRPSFFVFRFPFRRPSVREKECAGVKVTLG